MSGRYRFTSKGWGDKNLNICKKKVNMTNLCRVDIDSAIKEWGGENLYNCEKKV